MQQRIKKQKEARAEQVARNPGALLRAWRAEAALQDMHPRHAAKYAMRGGMVRKASAWKNHNELGLQDMNYKAWRQEMENDEKNTAAAMIKHLASAALLADAESESSPPSKSPPGPCREGGRGTKSETFIARAARLTTQVLKKLRPGTDVSDYAPENLGVASLVQAAQSLLLAAEEKRHSGNPSGPLAAKPGDVVCERPCGPNARKRGISEAGIIAVPEQARDHLRARFEEDRARELAGQKEKGGRKTADKRQRRPASCES